MRTVDRRTTRIQGPKANALTKEEEDAILERYNQKDVRDKSITQAFYHLLNNETYLASESTVYRIFRKKNLLKGRRGVSKSKKRHRPKHYVATAPNQIWCWDITYVRHKSFHGKFYLIYTIIDVFSRRVMLAKVYEHDCAENACEFLETAFNLYEIAPKQLVLHSDNGATMKALKTLALLDRYGVEFSHSRPQVSDDNPFIEAFFKTLKYCGWYRPFCSLEDGKIWLKEFIHYYNTEHLHSGIKWVTPDARYAGQDQAILEKRKKTIEAARQKHPERWASGKTLDCTYIETVELNPDKNSVNRKIPEYAINKFRDSIKNLFKFIEEGKIDVKAEFQRLMVQGLIPSSTPIGLML